MLPMGQPNPLFRQMEMLAIGKGRLFFSDEGIEEPGAVEMKF
jgi:hypothetical protein